MDENSKTKKQDDQNEVVELFIVLSDDFIPSPILFRDEDLIKKAVKDGEIYRVPKIIDRRKNKFENPTFIPFVSMNHSSILDE